MNNPRLAARYAKSLLDFSVEQGKLEEVYADMKLFSAVAKTNPEFVSLLKSPVITSEKKESLLKAVFDGKINDVTSGFIRLLISKTREANLPEMARTFITQYNKLKNIYPVKITTAVEITEDLEKSLLAKIRLNPDLQNIELEKVVDEKLIGGFKLQMGDQLVDATILHDLMDVRRQFLDNEYIHKIR